MIGTANMDLHIREDGQDSGDHEIEHSGQSAASCTRYYLPRSLKIARPLPASSRPWFR